MRRSRPLTFLAGAAPIPVTALTVAAGGGGARASLLGTTKRSDAAEQVVRPLATNRRQT
jgi:hypothetical protein